MEGDYGQNCKTQCMLVCDSSYIIPYSVLCNAVPGDAMPCPEMQCRTRRCNIVPGDAMPCPEMRCRARRCDAVPGDAMSYSEMQYRAWRCNAVPGDAMSCPEMQCRTRRCNAVSGSDPIRTIIHSDWIGLDFLFSSRIGLCGFFIGSNRI